MEESVYQPRLGNIIPNSKYKNKAEQPGPGAGGRKKNEHIMVEIRRKKVNSTPSAMEDLKEGKRLV